MKKAILILLAASIAACAPKPAPLAVNQGEDLFSYIARNAAERQKTAPVRYQEQRYDEQRIQNILSNKTEFVRWSVL